MRDKKKGKNWHPKEECSTSCSVQRREWVGGSRRLSENGEEVTIVPREIESGKRGEVPFARKE